MTSPRCVLPRRTQLFTAAIVGITATAIMAGCAATPDKGPEPSQAPLASPSAAPTADVQSLAVVPGYAPGQFPAVPLFILPDLSLLSDADSAFKIKVNDALGAIPGVTVTPAHCDESGSVINADGSAFLYGDGGGTYTGADGTIQNFGDGSGVSTINGVTIVNFGNGGGVYAGDDVTIENLGDGSGSYSSDTLTLTLDGQGAGTYVDDSETIENSGDGSGTYVTGDITVNNNGDGSGTYVDRDFVIENFGDGTASVNGEVVDAAPLPPVPRLGVFPPLGALAPLESCGMTLSFEDGVLFDFDKSDLRPDAAKTISAVSAVFAELNIGQASVSGHTDSVGDDGYNLQLSESRADAVVAAMLANGTTTMLDAQGFGETRPVAANEIDGVDNPAGRQLNRRVEIFISSGL